MLVADSALFTLGMNFVGQNTVLPALLVRLSASEVVVGLASGLISGAWLLPQLLVASAMARVRRQVPTIAVSAWLSRPLFLVMALVVAFYGNTNPALTIAVVIGGFTIWSALDAVVSVPWFQFVGRALPPRRRGRVLGFSQSLGAFGGIGAGIAVRFILSQNGPWSFPTQLCGALCGCRCLLPGGRPGFDPLARAARHAARARGALFASGAGPLAPHPHRRPPFSPPRAGAAWWPALCPWPARFTSSMPRASWGWGRGNRSLCVGPGLGLACSRAWSPAMCRTISGR